MKRIMLLITLSLLTILSASCSGTRENTATEEGKRKVLVVCYSATGSTEKVAGYIADALNADLFSLECVDAYTSSDLDWTDSESRVVKEHNGESLRNVSLVKTTPDNWDEYDTVFIGYPIWWGIAAWPVNSFIRNNDFSGKTVIPFCTSASSGLENSAELLEEMADGGRWLEGKRFRSSVSENDVVSWVTGLDF